MNMQSDDNQNVQSNNGNEQGGRFDNRQNRAKHNWVGLMSFTKADNDPNWQNQFLRHDLHLQLNQTVPQENGYTIHSLAISRVVTPGHTYMDSEGNERYVSPKTLPFLGIHTEIVEGKVQITQGTLDRLDDINEFYLAACSLVCEREQERHDRRLAENDERKNFRMGVQAQAARPPMRKGKTSRDNKNKRGGVVQDVPQDSQNADPQG